jgi:dihydroorotase
MPDADLAVRSTHIQTESGVLDGWIVVRDGVIVALADPRERPDAARVLDVGSLPVLPGVIDTHVHFRDPGFTDKEDFETGSRAAAAGGITTVFDMPNVRPVTNTVENFKAHIRNAAAKSIVDFGHNASAANPDTIGALAEAGATSFKIFMMKDVGRDYPHMGETAVGELRDLYRICEEVAKTGRTLFIHPHEQGIYEMFVERAQAERGMGPDSYAVAWRDGDGSVFNVAIAAILQIQRATGAKVHLLHSSTESTFEMVRQAKAEGRTVSTEVNPFSVFLSHTWEQVEKLGPYALGMWVPEKDVDAIWRALRDGAADVIASDHGPHTIAEKEIGWTDMYASPGGSPSVQDYFSLFLEAVSAGRLSLERLVELTSRRPAELTGLYPRKGAIRVGADADLVVVDFEREVTIDVASRYYKCGWTPYDGRKVTGAPVLTVLRGAVIAEDGKVLAEPGFGRYVGSAPWL